MKSEASFQASMRSSALLLLTMMWPVLVKAMPSAVETGSPGLSGLPVVSMVGFVNAGSSIPEGGTASISITMNAAPAGTVVVSISDAATGSATSGSDYMPFLSAQLSFLPEDTYPFTQFVSVITADEPNVEGNETVMLSLSLVAGDATLSVINHTLTILDNDPATTTGCSSSQTPYVHPLATGMSTRSLLTTGDQIGGYKMVGNSDGLGAFDNGDGTFTLLMNHEISGTSGIVRAHGSVGAFVSKWIINKATLCVLSGQDLVQTVYLWNGTGFTSGTTAFTRLCSADLPAPNAFYNVATGKGTLDRILLNGEENGTSGRAFAHIVTGTEARRTYQLPGIGRANWENMVACPLASEKTVVAALDDAGPGQVYFYIGTKQNTGNPTELAGLQNGNLYGVAVNGLPTEQNGSVPAPGTSFTLVNLGDVRNLTGAQLNTNSNAAGITNFQRPEDGAWNPSEMRDFYFATTNTFSSPSRLWRLRFTDPLQPELGGTITAVLDGTEGQKSLDNLTIDGKGHVLLQEDPGNNAHLAKIWRYTIATDALELIAQHDPARFISGGANFLTQDEESSGILDMAHILGEGRFLFTVMAHYPTTTELVEGGQLLLLNTGSKVGLQARVHLEGAYDAATGLLRESLRANGLVPLSQPYSALGYTFTPGDTGLTSAPVLANAHPTNAIVDWLVVELRSEANPAAVVCSRSALLQRDGDVVGMDGHSPLSFKTADGSYYVAIRHRNHLGAMTAAPVVLNAFPAIVDFTSASTATYGTDPRKSISGAFPTEALWSGDVSFDGALRYTGEGNDRDPILLEIGGSVPTNTINGYHSMDVDMNGVVRYTGQDNDRDPILLNIGGSIPTNVRLEQLP